MSEEAFAWFVGVDWGSEKHQVCILDQQGTVVGERSFPHGFAVPPCPDEGGWREGAG